MLAKRGLKYAKSYSACIGQMGQRIFFSLAATKIFIVMAGDATNACAQSPPPSEETFVNVNQQYIDWYFDRYGTVLDKSMVLSVNHALQGHPESGVLWADLINGHLEEMGFINTDHEPCLYRGMVLACRQVDDFSFASGECDTVIQVLQELSKRIDFIPESDFLSRYNGIDVEQTRDYIKIHSATYIDKIMANHSWSQPNRSESTFREPILPSVMHDVMTHIGSEDVTVAMSLEKEMGFSFRTVLGEMIYAYVTTQLDIGNLVADLSRFTTRPAKVYYEVLKRGMKFLRHTRTTGLVFWRTSPRPDLPIGDITPRSIESVEHGFPHPTDLSSVYAYVDASHATCIRTRRSTGVHIICLAGTAIAYKAKLQPMVVTSSTEAEFIAAVSCAKALKHVRHILSQLGKTQTGSSVIHEDNQAAVMMANARTPTERTRHLDIQYFALLEWVANGDVILAHIPGTINPADVLTKTVAKLLFWRYTSRLMGYAGSPFSHIPLGRYTG